MISPLQRPSAAHLSKIGRLAYLLTAALLCLFFTGCQTHKTTGELGGGYEEISHPTHHILTPFDSQPNPPRISLEYKDPQGKITTVWPDLYCPNQVANGDLVIFVAEKAYLTDHEYSIRPRLFAVRSPELPVDITDEILWRWSKANQKELTKTFTRFADIIPSKKDGSLALRLNFFSGEELTDEDWPDSGDLVLDWPQVDEIMRAVRLKGEKETDLRWHTPYIGEKF